MAHTSREELLINAIRLSAHLENSSYDPTVRRTEAWWTWSLGDGETIKVGLIAHPGDVSQNGDTLKAHEAVLIHVVNNVEQAHEKFACHRDYLVYRSANRSPRLHIQLKALRTAQQRVA